MAPKKASRKSWNCWWCGITPTNIAYQSREYTCTIDPSFRKENVLGYYTFSSTQPGGGGEGLGCQRTISLPGPTTKGRKSTNMSSCTPSCSKGNNEQPAVDASFQTRTGWEKPTNLPSSEGAGSLYQYLALGPLEQNSLFSSPMMT